MKNIVLTEELVKFLKIAKLNTFSSENNPVRDLDGSKTYLFSNDGFRYQDKYYGRLIDVGQEIVWFNDIPVWGMSYRGGMISNEEIATECFSFLKESLRSIPDNFPVRGYDFYEKNPFQYVHTHVGDISDFVGKESILLNSQKIYFRNYLGGLIKHK